MLSLKQTFEVKDLSLKLKFAVILSQCCSWKIYFTLKFEVSFGVELCSLKLNLKFEAQILSQRLTVEA